MLAVVAFCTVASQDATAADATAQDATKQAAPASSDVGLKGAGLKLGFVGPDGMDATPGLGVFVDLGTVGGERVRLEPFLDYWSQTEEIPNGEETLRDIAIGLRAKYLFPVPSKVQPFAGIGMGLHFFKSKATTGTTTVEDSPRELGMDIGAGIATALNPSTDFLGEMWYGFANEVSQFSVRVGLEFKIGG
jgi:opacity protein-like surface antigen